MLFKQDRNQLRQFYIDSWNKKKNEQPLEPLESLVATIIENHPEYHTTLEDSDKALSNDYTPEQGESNPFLHMGMHIAIHEQLHTGRPQGILETYQLLLNKLGDPHEVEHQMMECFGQIMWEAQRSGDMPDEQEYLECLKRLA